jgi:dihydropteroate synthase
MNRFNKMGEINITPDSFSDGNLYNHQDTFKNHFNKLTKWADTIDIGAESTAPFNSSIDSLDELERFEEVLFPYVASTPDPKIKLSIDTYKPEVFYEVYLFVKKFWPRTRLVFNDVSGCVDDELIDLLSLNLDFDYILCHNLCPSRDLTSSHMKYVDHTESNLAFSSMIHKMKMDLSILAPLKRTILIDPCFGFSKTRAQNHFLLKNMSVFCDAFKDCNIVYGISRKSFLRVPKDVDPRDPDNKVILDQMQGILIHELITENSNQFTFRVHDVHSIKSALNIASILE